MAGRPAAGGGRWVSVAPERLARWLSGFEQRHGAATLTAGSTEVVLTAQDGAIATVEVPFPPLQGDLVGHVTAERVVGVLLVRRGGHAAGLYVGARLVSSKVGTRHVQGRTAAGGWSQQRFARRREGQAAAAYAAAADVASKVLLERPLDGVVLGGDRQGVDAVLQDPRLAVLRPLVTGRLLDVPDPRLKVLQEVAFRDVWIRVEEPG
ncbi:MAG TPA: acVLRF1 family peptidyl-tRNA hydrolase [Mycobacteriales bacterium]|nr:acVLRF1 family peptidyl-tRNA hydrolase [Mycobacteriales bacterium]